MRAIVLDHVRRWWWLWLACCVGCVVFVGVGHPLKADLSNVPFFPLAMYFGVVQLSSDLQRGDVARVLRTLPVTSRQIGRAWWWASVGLPALTMAVVVGLVFVFIAQFTHRAISGLACFNFWLANSLWLTPAYFFFTGIPAAGLWRNRATGFLFSVLFAASFLGMLYGYRMFGPRTAQWEVFVVAAPLLAFGGWIRSEAFARDRLVSVPTVSEKSNAAAMAGAAVDRNLDTIFRPLTGKRVPSTPGSEGPGGLALVFQNIFYPIFGLGMFMVISVGLILYKPLSSGDDAGLANILWSVFSIFPWFATFIVTPRALLQARWLRTAPVSPARLAGVLILAPLSAMAAFMSLSNLILGLIYPLPQMSFLSMLREGCLLQMALTTLVVPLILWRGMDAIMEAIILVLMGGCAFGSLYVHQHFAFTLSVGASLSLVLASFLMTVWLFKCNSRIYRPRTGQRGFFFGTAGQ